MKPQIAVGVVKTQYNRELHPCNYEINEKPSLTIPDQTMSIRTIIDRYTRGLPVNGQMFQPTFQEGEEFDPMPDNERLDLHDRMELAQNARQELDEIKEKLNNKKAKSSVEPKVLPEVEPKPTQAEPEAVEQKNEPE